MVSGDASSHDDALRGFWRGKKTVVTGGAGFIGMHLAKRLVDFGAVVTVVDRKSRETLPEVDVPVAAVLSGATYAQADVRDSGFMGKVVFGVDAVFHLAAVSIVGEAYADPTEVLDTNIRGTWTLLEACRKAVPEARIVIASSDKAYGAGDVLPYREDLPLKGRHPYDCSKSCEDLVAMMYAETYGLKVAVTRCGNVYGGGDFNFSRLIPDAIRSFLDGRTFAVRSDGRLRRDYVYIDDIVSAYLETATALDRPEVTGQAFNFGNRCPRDVVSVVKDVATALGTEAKYEILGTARGEIVDQYLDSTKAERTLGWKPRVSWEDGLAVTVAWYRDRHPGYGLA